MAEATYQEQFMPAKQAVIYVDRSAATILGIYSAWDAGTRRVWAPAEPDPLGELHPHFVRLDANTGSLTAWPAFPLYQGLGALSISEVPAAPGDYALLALARDAAEARGLDGVLVTIP
jgi:hypothetical protein